MAERELGIVIRAKDLASRTIANVNRQLGNIGSNVSRGLSNAVRNVERGVTAIGVAALGGIAYSLRAAGDFEAQLNTINTVAQATPEVLGHIGEGIRKLARDTGTSHADLTAAYYDLVSAGIKAADAQNVLTAANTLAIGGLSTTQEAVDLLTTAINSYGGDASKAGQYADQFAQAIAAGKVTAAEIAASFAQVGPLAAQMGIGVDEISASLGLMTAKGTPAAEAFTQIRAAMIALQRQTPAMERVLGELGIADAALYADTYGLAPLFDKLTRKAAELGIPMIELTGRVEGSMYAAQNAGTEFANYEAALDKVKDASGVAAEQMSERQQGLNYQLGRVKTLAYDAAITLGTALLPKITPLVAKFAEWVDLNQAGIGTFAKDVADGVERAVKWALSLDWNMIANSLKAAAGFARGIGEAFLGLPSWIQVAVLTGWGLNKLTGGALGSILGGLRGSSPLTPMYTKEVGIGGGLPGGRGPGGRVPGRGPGLLLGLTGVGLAAILADEFEEEIEGFAGDLRRQIVGDFPGLPSGPSEWEWPFGSKNTPTILPEVFGDNGFFGGTPAAPSGGAASPGRGGASASFTGPAGRASIAKGAADADRSLLAQFGGTLGKLATNEVIEHLARTTEIGMKGIGTSMQLGLQTGQDKVGDIATQILARAENPLAPPVLFEIQGHIAGLEEIQAQYLANGDVKLAQKVQANIDTLHDLIGTTDSLRGVTEMLKADAAGADRVLIQNAQLHSAQNDVIAGRQRETIDSVRASTGRLDTIAAKNFSPTVNVSAQVDSYISIHEWQRTVTSSIRAYGPGAYTAV